MKRYGIEWPELRSILQEGEKGEARIKFFEISDDQARMAGLRAAINAAPGLAVDTGKHVQLFVNGSMVMSDTRQEKRDNTEPIDRAEGDVLIAGLGLGMMLIPVALRESVKSITVLELSQDVIDLVWPKIEAHLRTKRNGAADKVQVIQADVFDFKPKKGKKWDIIWLDIWADICTDNVEGINRLKQKFKGRLNRTNQTCWMGAWKEDHLRWLKRTGRWR